MASIRSDSTSVSLWGEGLVEWGVRMNMQTRHDTWLIEHDERALKEAERIEPAGV